MPPDWGRHQRGNVVAHWDIFRWAQAVDGSPIEVLVGQLTLGAAWRFQYNSRYLKHYANFGPLDPYQLPLRQSAFKTEGPEPFRAFEPLSLSGWSHAALAGGAAEAFDIDDPHSTPTVQQWMESLSWDQPMGFGAIRVKAPPMNRRVVHLKMLLAAMGLNESEVEANGLHPEPSFFIGASPKFSAIYNDNGTPRQVVVKLVRPGDNHSRTAAEATVLSLAKELGIDTPWHKVVHLGPGVHGLAVARFDRTTDNHPVHCLSADSVLMTTASTKKYDKARSYLKLAYHLEAPDDKQDLFKRLVLNLVIGNAEERPRNTYLRQIAAESYRLAPYFTSRPQLKPSLKGMAYSLDNERSPTLATLTLAGQNILNEKKKSIEELIAETHKTIKARWRRLMAYHGGYCEAEHFMWAPVFERKH